MKGVTDPGPNQASSVSGLELSGTTVTVTFDDGTSKELFSFYPDEIQFGEGELVGLTEAEARALCREKDVERDWIMSATQSKEYGIIDLVIKHRE